MRMCKGSRGYDQEMPWAWIRRIDMVYRHIYWGLLQIGPESQSMLTEAVKRRNYLIKIVTPDIYKTKEDAREDLMEYSFHVGVDDVSLFGFISRKKTPEREGEDLLKNFDVIKEKDWTKYQMIRLYDDTKITEGRISERLCECGYASAKHWKKIFPVIGTYPVKKVASTIIALPDVKELEE